MTGLSNDQKITERRSLFANPFFIAYAISNLIGLLIYFVADTSISSLAHSEKRDYYDGVDGVTYFCTVVPILAVLAPINLAWGIKSLIDVFSREDSRAFKAFVVFFILWFVEYHLCGLIAIHAIAHGTNHFPD